MVKNLDTGLLRAFVAIVETGGMTAAGSRLNLTQAAVSQQLKRLETVIGKELVDRDRKGMRLTNAGERLFGQARKLLALNDEILTEMSVPLHEGEIRLGIPGDIVSTYLPTFMKNFAKAYPKVQVSPICTASVELLRQFHAGKLDLTLTTELGCGPDGQTLIMDRLVWVGARGGQAAFARPLPVATGSSECVFREPIREALQEYGIEWRSVSDITDTHGQVATTAADLSVSAFMAATVPSSLEVIEAKSGLPRLPHFSINLYVPKGSAEVVQELARHIRGAITERHRLAA